MNKHDTALLAKLHHELGIAEDYALQRGLPPFEQAPLEQLRVMCIDRAGRPLLLTEATILAWQKLTRAASDEGIELDPFSGFRAYQYQAFLVQQQLKKGRDIAEILTHIAPPGFSEHHTGRALDIAIPGGEALTEAFEETPAFMWLETHAGTFGFSMSFGRDNDQGFIYEPWHWCFDASHKSI